MLGSGAIVSRRHFDIERFISFSGAVDSVRFLIGVDAS
jgi:hypothetical protein